MEDIFTTIGNLGFPIAVAVYLLVRLEKRIGALEESIRNLSDSINDKL